MKRAKEPIMSKEVTEYIAVYKKDPFSVSLNVDSLKNGAYYIEGDVSEANWFNACEQIDVPKSGKCHISCTLNKRGNVLKFMGDIQTEMRRECVRTLKVFDEKETIHFDEEVYIDEVENEEGAMKEALHGSVLEMKDYLTQQIILHMNTYPVHPDTLSAKKGAFGLDDGQEKAIKKEKLEKNPFSVLKGLKSES